MKIKLKTIALLMPMISSCAHNYGVNNNTSVHHDPIEDVRKISLESMKRYTSGTRKFLDENGEQQTIVAAQNEIRKKLKDPDSAKFQNVIITNYNGDKVVCGEVNAKNSYGGYVGYKKFAAGVSGGSIYDKLEYQDIDAANNAGIIAACGYK